MRPAWNPNWNDVSFDHVAVLRAAEESEGVAAALDDTGHVRADAARTTFLHWQGPRRDHFETELRSLSARNADVASALRRLAHRLRERSEEAHVEQERREAAREEWHRQRQALEERARRLAPEAGAG